jgi:3-oxoacyl-[acyl-carrier-protein] synthase III
MFLSRLAAWRPEQVLSNLDLSKLVDTSDEWIFEHVGIRERRRAPPDMPVHQLGARAARAALEGVDAASIDLVVCALSVSDYQIPSTANLVAAEAGLPNAAAFDLRAACSSFVFGLHALRGMLATGQHRRALLVVPEAYTRVVDYTDRNTCVLWGDAAAACLVTAERPAGLSLEVEDTRIGSRSNDWAAVQIPVGGHFQQQGATVQGFAIRKMAAIAGEQLAARSLAPADVAFFVGHQANAGILSRVCERAGFSPAQSLTNLEKFGNTGAAGAPSVLADNQEKFRDGQRILVATVGAGLSWGTALFKTCREDAR